MINAKVQLIDTHAHIYSEELIEDIDLIYKRWQDQGVQKVVMPNIDESSIEPMIALSRHIDGCFNALGLHPCYVKEDYAKQLDHIFEYFDKVDVVAVGEVGIDMYWDKTSFDRQKTAFEIQIGWAHDKGLPLLIHSRDAQDITIEMISEHQDGKLKGVFHCFSGSVEESQKAVDLGFYIGIGGAVTYKNSGLAEVLKHIPITSIVLETDSPYLPPVPFRGKKNEPAYLGKILEKVAEVYQLSIEVVAMITTKNANKLFGFTPKDVEH